MIIYYQKTVFKRKAHKDKIYGKYNKLMNGIYLVVLKMCWKVGLAMWKITIIIILLSFKYSIYAFKIRFY